MATFASYFILIVLILLACNNNIQKTPEVLFPVIDGIPNIIKINTSQKITCGVVDKSPKKIKTKINKVIIFWLADTSKSNLS